MISIDGNKLILGRLATHVAKNLLNGNEVHIFNCEGIVISGSPEQILANFRTRRALQHKGTPEHSPQWSKNPTLLIRRIIQGMLPMKSTRGQNALRKLRVYRGNPKSVQLVSLDSAKFNSESRFMTMGELCKELGFKAR